MCILRLRNEAWRTDGPRNKRIESQNRECSVEDGLQGHGGMYNCLTRVRKEGLEKGAISNRETLYRKLELEPHNQQELPLGSSTVRLDLHFRKIDFLALSSHVV